MHQSPPRDLVWDGCLNVRELGGLPTTDGGETRRGAVVRADSVRQLSLVGWQTLLEHGIRTVVDLRSDRELLEDPPADTPVDVRHVPFLRASDAEWAEIDAELDAAVAAAPDTPTATREVYLIMLERFKANVAAGIRAVIDAPAGGVVIHCAGGKDRTGLLAAFLLHAAGVATADIAADYALSEERLRPRLEAWLAGAKTEEEREQMRRMSRTPYASMFGAFAALEERYGSVEGYLRSTGLNDDELERVRARLRG